MFSKLPLILVVSSRGSVTRLCSIFTTSNSTFQRYSQYGYGLKIDGSTDPIWPTQIGIGTGRQKFRPVSFLFWTNHTFYLEFWKCYQSMNRTADKNKECHRFFFRTWYRLFWFYDIHSSFKNKIHHENMFYLMCDWLYICNFWTKQQ
jgi:hypothetical protein